MFKEPKIIFHHIPKCGGTSIVSGLAISYYPMRLLIKGRKGFQARLNAPQSTHEAQEKGVNSFSYRRQLLREHVEKKKSPFISGHYPFDRDLYEQVQNEWCFVTLLRDPLQRWYSEYFWNRYKDHAYKKTNLSMEEYLGTEQGRENTRSFVNYFAMTENTHGDVTEEDKNEALNSLQKFSVLGILEELNDFKTSLKMALGYKPFFPRLNKSPASPDKKIYPDKGSDFEKTLLSALEADIEIYKKAKEYKGL